MSESEKSTSRVSNRSSSRSRTHSETAHRAMGKELRLQSIEIHNFKAIKDLVVAFPSPRMKSDPDIFAMGSRNGLGKTSVLEACSMLFIAATIGEDPFTLGLRRYSEASVDLFDLMIRAGAENAQIHGTFTFGDKIVNIDLALSRKRGISIKGDKAAFQEFVKKLENSQPYKDTVASKFSLSLTGLSSDPMFLSSFMYFHSYRKVQEGSLQMGRMLEDEQLLRKRLYTPGREVAVSSFKLEMLRLLMRRGGLFENLDDDPETEEVLNRLNNLMKQYTGGTIEKLRPSLDNTVEFRVTPVNGGPSFTFDGLSSGQKEIISTLFLIWRYTQKQSGIVLIDEPELHLNPEWHRGFIQYLYELAPNNQYIIATHSEDVFAAVDKDHRILLISEDGDL